MACSHAGGRCWRSCPLPLRGSGGVTPRNFFEIFDAKSRIWGQFGPENKLIEGQPNEYDVICRNASVLAFHLWPTIFAGAPFRLQNICRNGVPPRSRTTTPLVCTDCVNCLSACLCVGISRCCQADRLVHCIYAVRTQGFIKASLPNPRWFQTQTLADIITHCTATNSMVMWVITVCMTSYIFLLQHFWWFQAVARKHFVPPTNCKSPKTVVPFAAPLMQPWHVPRVYLCVSSTVLQSFSVFYHHQVLPWHRDTTLSVWLINSVLWLMTVALESMRHLMCW